MMSVDWAVITDAHQYPIKAHCKPVSFRPSYVYVRSVKIRPLILTGFKTDYQL